MPNTGPTPDQPHRPAHVDVTEDEATGDLLEPTEEDIRKMEEMAKAERDKVIDDLTEEVHGMLALGELARNSFEIAKSKGWWDTDRSFAALTLLMQSEIAEALEDYRANKRLNEVWYEHKGPMGHTMTISSEPQLNGIPSKPCGIPIELADFIIRCADFAGRYNLNLSPVVEVPEADFEKALALASSEVSIIFITLNSGALYEKWWAHDIGAVIGLKLSKAIQHIVDMCKAQGIEIEKAIQIKAEYNKTRPARHGGKKV